MNFRMILIFATLYIFGVGHAQSPSFDCELASTLVEVQICEVDELARKDMQLSSIFSAIPQQRKRDILPLQRAWINQRDACALSSIYATHGTSQEELRELRGCISRTYTNQISVLSRIKEQAEGLTPISGNYGYTSVIYPSNYDYDTTSLWSLEVTALADIGTYLIEPYAVVGPTHHFCGRQGYYSFVAKRDGHNLIFDYERWDSEAQSHVIDQGWLSYDPKALSFTFTDHDRAGNCGMRAYLQGVPMYLSQ